MADVGEWVAFAVEAVPVYLGRRPTRRWHFAVSASSAQTRELAGRDLSPTSLVAGWHDERDALVLLHAPELDPRNRDGDRMRGHLCHECSHLLVAERSGSTKVFGDEDVRMRVPSWLDEGIADLVSAEICGRHDLVAAALDRAPRTTFRSLAEVDTALRNLDAPERGAAFTVATALVHALGGARSAFDRLDGMMGWTAFEDGATVGGRGSEGGTIDLDEEHDLGARITLEVDAGRIPFAITCGVYGWMCHTCYFGSREIAEAEYSRMKHALRGLLDLISVPNDVPDAHQNLVVDAIGRFVEEFR